MSIRQVIVLVIAAVCLVMAGIRIAKSLGLGGSGSSKGFHETWRCRGDGYMTNMTLAELDAQVEAGTTREDPTNAVPTIMKCPKCGKIALECIRTWN